MSAVLVPVDFSLPCHNAYRYALHLAAELGLDVVLSHYSPGAISTNQPFSFIGEGSLHDIAMKRLEHFAASTAEGIDYPLLEPPAGVALSFETEVVFSVSASIIDRAAQSDIAAVVMAPRSSGQLLGKWLGSTSTTVSESCNRPVFIVPEEVSFRPWKQIVVANNHTTAEPYPLWQIEKLTERYAARVHFVHVEWPRQYGPLRFVPWPLMEELVDNNPARYPFEVITVEARDITEGLKAYADDVDADLILIINHVRNRWRALLHASLTQDVALRANRPVLVLHDEDGVATAGILAGERTKAT